MNSKPTAADQNSPRSSPFLRRAEQVLGPRAAEPEESFDALTDLFLGEVASAPAAKSHATAAPVAEARPVLRLTSDEDVEEEPAPVSEPEKPVQPVAAAAAVARPGSEPMRDAIVECIVLGNLPVLASAWASQYVREVSAAAGRPVAFVRVQSGFASVELVGEWAGGSGPVSSASHERLEDALKAAACLTDRWILRVDSGQEAGLVGHALVRVVSVLTGIDEMARMAAFAAVKNLSPALPSADGPLLRLAVMGAGDEQSRSTGRVLAEAAEKIVNRPVQHVSCSAKIRSTRSPVSLFSGATESNSASVLAMIANIVGVPSAPRAIPADARRDQPAQTAPATPAEPAFTRVAAHVEEELAAVHAPVQIETKADVRELPTDDIHQTVVMAPAAAPAPVTISIPAPPPAPPAPAVPAPMRPAPAETVRPAALLDEPKPAPAIAPPAAATPVQPPAFAEIGVLSAHITGLRSVPLQCPYAPGVELALDAHGGLHLLTRSASSASDDAAIGTLMVASSWAESHSQLLVASGLPVTLGGRPTLHLFTDEPKRSRRLLETSIRVHLLAPIALGGRTGWFCTELN